VTSLSAPALSEAGTVLCIFGILLVPCAGAGLGLINAGLGRVRSAAHSMTASLCVVAVAAVMYAICGFSFQGFSGQPAHIVMAGGKPWSWMAAQPWFLRGLAFDGSPASLVAWLELFSVGIAALIPLGAGADRWRLSSLCLSSALFAGWTYPLFAHWAWGGGWLAQLGLNYGLGNGFLDAAGSSTIHVVGGLTALAVTWILGPRRGKYSPNGMPAAIPGHNAPLVMFGCFLAWVGWLGLNTAGSLLFVQAEPGRTALAGINTTLSAAGAGLAAAAVTHLRFGKPDASLTANGWVAGLVSSSAGCVLMKPFVALIVGLLAGALVPLAVEFFEFRLQVDDPGGAVSVHAVGGIWGVVAAGLFASFPEPRSGQWLAQIVGVATLIGCILPLSYGLNWLLDRFHRLRVSIDGERQGMDLHELGADAYPEFVTHSDEFTQR
jgi:ammonium transporter, Amt family